MVKSGPGRQGSRWRRTQAAIIAHSAANSAPCVLCGLAIDYVLTSTQPRHRLAATVHHLVGLAEGGDPLDPSNLAPAHRGCNTREWHRVRRQRKYGAAVVTSRRW